MRCKWIVYLFSAILIVLINGRNLAAQEDEKGSADHPLISRFPGSYILTYDLKQFNEYLLPLGKMSKDTLEKSLKLEGKVTQITYAAPKDRSILEIYRSYETFLKNNGFITLFSANKEELGDGWLSKYISATPRAYRYGQPGLDTRIRDNFVYLVTRKDRKEGSVYVALCVATSWYQDFPVIQLDVIETKPMDASMMNIIKEPTEKQGDKKVSLTEQIKQVKTFEVRVGIGCHAFIDPVLAGTSSNNFKDNSTGTVTGSLTGFKILTGPYVNARYFFNENIGISADIGSLINSIELYTSEAYYFNKATMFYQKIGFVGQIVGKITPVRMSLSMGAGNCITELYKKTTYTPPATGTDTFLLGKANMFMAYINLDISVPIYKKLYLFGNFEYNVMPVWEFVMEHDGGNDYSDTYYGLNYGGFQIRGGLSYSF
ncbi:hypothetical protein [Tenuifilum osseticum]|uniref:hypothetical protein n=1 Tax=Tenuifilum osseticum TaxID=3374723 RepID=UPI0034E5A089